MALDETEKISYSSFKMFVLEFPEDIGVFRLQKTLNIVKQREKPIIQTKLTNS
jgi:hypothetical protein